MRTSQAARYARGAAAVAILLTVVVAGVYLRRNWQARKVTQSAPPPVPPSVQQRSEEFSFSKVEKERTIFTVRASRATAFKQGSKSLLEDVWITIYGRKGQRLDNIHTQACDYLSDHSQVICAGKVQIDLQSAQDAKRYGSDPRNPQAAAHMEHIETTNLSFDKETGIARTDRAVDFRFPDGEGHATGASYSSQDNVMRLLRDVRVTSRLKHSLSSEAGPPAPIEVTGGSLEYDHDAHTLRLLAPVLARQGSRELHAQELAVELDADYRVRRVVARPEGPGRQVELQSLEPRGLAVLNADEFVVLMNPEGWAERAQANGSVRGSMTRDAGEDRISSAKLELQFVPKRNQPDQVTASGDVVALTNSRGRLQRLETSALRLTFAPKGLRGRRELEHAETLAAGTFEWQVPGAAGQPAREITRISGQRLTADFATQGRLLGIAAKNGMSIERRLPEKPIEFSSAREAVVHFDAEGEWTEVDEEGAVRFREGNNAAQADHAKIDRATDTLTLSGSMEVTDGTMRLAAQSAEFNQRTADFHADGAVRTTYLKVDLSSPANFAPQPAFVVADRLQGNASGGRAFYSGRVRFWQGDSAIEADSIELLRDAQRLTARGNVTAAFLQAAGTSPLPVPQRVSAASRNDRPDLWRIHSGTLTYWSGEARALLDGGVTADSSQAGISSKTLELFFAPGAGPSAASSQAGSRPTGSPAGAGPLQLARAVATRNVVVHQGDRKGMAEKAIYTAAEQKFVLSGGTPTLYDGPRGSTTGRELTFFFASDTILVDSEEGLRTLTKHRVEK